MAEKKGANWSLSRREALKVCLAPAGVAATRWLVACTDAKESTADDDADQDENQRDGDTSSASEERDAGTMRDGRAQVADANAGSDSDDDDEVEETDPGRDARTPATADARASNGRDAGSDASPAADASTGDVPWATGGTKSMQGDYPDPFVMGATGTACAVYPAQTLGPCYAEPVMEREDISDEMTGLPVRLSFLVVSSDGCTPVPDVEVDIWHTGSNGIYSAFASGICNPDRLDVADESYCRGRKTCDENGRVDFSTIFPGWYTGRSIHIHFTVRAGGREYITSQLYFDDALTDEIMMEPVYNERGRRDTTNQNDAILRGGDLQQFLFSTAKRTDGALHAWKVLSIRT